MSEWILFPALSAATFLLGGVPFGFVLGKIRGLDVRKHGSGNIGAANVGRLLGRNWGIAVFVLDAAKGFAAAFLVGLVVLHTQPSDSLKTSTLRLVASLCAVLGHNYSPYLGFRGGKGVATSLGLALGVYPQLTIPGLGSFGVWATLILLTRISSVGSIFAGLSFPLFVLAWLARDGWSGADWPFMAFGIVVAMMLVVRHRPNIRRLLEGTEPRMGSSQHAQAKDTLASAPQVSQCGTKSGQVSGS